MLAVAVGLVGAVLAGVEDVELGEQAPPQPPVEPGVGADGQLRGAQGLVLPVGAVGGGPAQQEVGRRGAVLGDRTSLVVVGLVVVEVGEHAVGVVARAADSVDGVFVHVVAEVEDEVDVVPGEVAVGGEVAVLVLLAGAALPAAGAVRVRPVSLSQVPVRKR